MDVDGEDGERDRSRVYNIDDHSSAQLPAVAFHYADVVSITPPEHAERPPSFRRPINRESRQSVARRRHKWNSLSIAAPFEKEPIANTQFSDIPIIRRAPKAAASALDDTAAARLILAGVMEILRRIASTVSMFRVQQLMRCRADAVCCHLSFESTHL